MVSETPSRRVEWLLIGLLLLIFLIKGVVWSLALPLWQGPDEEDHFNVIQFIGELGRLPDTDDTFLVDEVALSRQLADVGRLPYAPEQRQAFSDSAEGLNESAFAELPPETRTSFELGMVGKLNKATPLWYALASVPYRLLDGDLLWRAQVQRLFSLLMSSGIVVVAYLTAALLFPTRPAMRLTIPILVAFHPMITQITAVVSVDGFYFLCYSILIYLSVRIFRDGFDWRYGLAVGLMFAVGVLTKPTLNGYAPLIALLVLIDWIRGKGRRWSVFWGAVVMGIAIVIPLGWWMLRSLRINDDLFYFNPVLEGHRIIQNPFYDYGIVQHAIDYYQSVWGGIFITWWGHFGWIDTALPPLVYDVLRVLTWAAMAGLALGLWRWWRRRTSAEINPFSHWFDAWKAGRRSAPLLVWGFLALSLLVPILLIQVYDITFWWQYGNGRGLQGRYWLGTIVPMMTFFALGLLTWLPPKWHPAGHNLLRVGMVLLNGVSLLGYVIPRFYL